jgi:hypothetical protein
VLVFPAEAARATVFVSWGMVASGGAVMQARRANLY